MVVREVRRPCRGPRAQPTRPDAAQAYHERSSGLISTDDDDVPGLDG
jgi:hypothetical protein